VGSLSHAKVIMGRNKASRDCTTYFASLELLEDSAKANIITQILRSTRAPGPVSSPQAFELGTSQMPTKDQVRISTPSFISTPTH
jgi:hypothetical protein